MTDQNIDLSCLPISQPSLCIPRVFNNIGKPRILSVFNKLNLGNIRRIDIVERTNKNGEHYESVYIHFEKWHWNETAQSVRRKVLSGKELKIVYDNPWFWKVSANRTTSNATYKHSEGTGTYKTKEPYIELHDNCKTPRTLEKHQNAQDSDQLFRQTTYGHNVIELQQSSQKTLFQDPF